MQDFSRFVPNVHFEQIPIKNLVSNQEYQRPLSQAQVESHRGLRPEPNQPGKGEPP